jgi:hypothetical protein
MDKTHPKPSVWPLVIVLLMALAVIAENIVLFLSLTLPFDPKTVYIAGMSCAVLALIFIIAGMAKNASLRRALEKERGKVSVIAPPRPSAGAAVSDVQAMTLLSLLQEKGRFVDFVMEDVAAYSNEQVGAAARVVHQGCREVIRDCFDPRPITERKENAEIILEPGFDPAQYRLTGKVAGQPPFKGSLIHKGWKAGRVRLPKPNAPSALPETPVIVAAQVNL